MKYLRKYESHEDIDAICKTYGIENYTINSDGSIDVNGYVNLLNKGLIVLLPMFRNIRGSFDCDYNKLTNLKGCPKSIGGSFYCNHNELTSLIGCPKSIGGGFYCDHNNLTSLQGCPKSVGGDFSCQLNEIESFGELDFIHIGGNFYCYKNPIYVVWILFQDHTKFEFFNDCDIIREDRVIILDRLNFFLDYIGKRTVTEVEGYKCI
jgi:hypothetical protein